MMLYHPPIYLSGQAKFQFYVMPMSWAGIDREPVVPVETDACIRYPVNPAMRLLGEKLNSKSGVAEFAVQVVRQQLTKLGQELAL